MCIPKVCSCWYLFSGVLGFLLSKNFWGQIGTHGLMIYATCEGLRVASAHIEKQSGASFFATCDLFPNFPSWMPLHEWLPSIFAATGDCSDISWRFFEMSMPEWVFYIFLGYMALQMIMLIWVVGDHADRMRCKKIK